MSKSTDAGLGPGNPGYRAASLALFITALVTFAMLYSTQPLLPQLLSLRLCQPLALSAFHLRLMDPVSERFLRHPELTCDDADLPSGSCAHLMILFIPN